MFGRRPDATLAQNVAPMRRIMPFVSPRRNDSVFHLAFEVDVEAAIEFLEKRNRERPPDRPITLFHLLLRSTSQCLVLRPGINRFVKGGRLWQHDAVRFTFSALREIADGARMLTIKRRFEPETETLDEMVDGIYAKLRPARAGVQSTSDRETSLLLRLPAFLTALLVRGADLLDRFGLLPRAMIEPDPLFCSIFFGNLGSVGHEAGWHHLWERGTCSIFGVMGKVKPGPNGRRGVTICWTYDERIEDGIYSCVSMAGIKERIENPELLLLGTAELAAKR
jgi:hypothetical protein